MFNSFSQVLIKAWARRKTTFSKGIDYSLSRRQQPKPRGTSIPSLSEAWARQNTAPTWWFPLNTGNFSNMMYSQVWIWWQNPFCTLTSTCRLRRQSHQNKPRLEETSSMSITLRKGRQEAYGRAQMFLPSHSLHRTAKENAPNWLHCLVFHSTKKLGTENFLKQIVTEFLLKRKAQAPFIKSNISIMKWTSGNMFYS